MRNTPLGSGPRYRLGEASIPLPPHSRRPSARWRGRGAGREAARCARGGGGPDGERSDLEVPVVASTAMARGGGGHAGVRNNLVGQLRTPLAGNFI